MTERQANTMRERILTEMPDVQAEVRRKGKKGWDLKLKNMKLKREFIIVNAGEWEFIKMAWQA